jgi:hypothetical protein
MYCTWFVLLNSSLRAFLNVVLNSRRYSTKLVAQRIQLGNIVKNSAVSLTPLFQKRRFYGKYRSNFEAIFKQALTSVSGGYIGSCLMKKTEIENLVPGSF